MPQPSSAVVAIPEIQENRSGVLTESRSVVTPSGIDADTATREDAVKRLKFWWLMANEAERERFRRWMKQVDNAEKQAKIVISGFLSALGYKSTIKFN